MEDPGNPNPPIPFRCQYCTNQPIWYSTAARVKWTEQRGVEQFGSSPGS